MEICACTVQKQCSLQSTVAMNNLAGKEMGLEVGKEQRTNCSALHGASEGPLSCCFHVLIHRNFLVCESVGLVIP